MREILFRGKTMDNGEWVEGAYFKHDTVKVCFSSDDPKPKHFIIQDGFCDWGFEPPIHCVEVDPNTVGQFTGLTDKKGRKIFEGDILEAHYDDKFPNNATRTVVVWGGGLPDDTPIGWMMKQGDYEPDTLCFCDSKMNRVISNIHDSPELLNQ